MHALLHFLEAKGFSEAPRVLGFDDKGREALTYIKGGAATRPWPSVLLNDEGLVQAASLLKRYHEVVADFLPSKDARWRVETPLRPGEIIRHADFGPWNTIWREDQLVGLIDWDFAEPGPPILDVAQLAWFFVPLTTPEGVAEAGFATPPDLRARLHLACRTYGGISEAEVLDAVDAVQRTDLQRVVEWGGRGIEPWAGFRRRGEIERIEADMAWLASSRRSLI